MAESGLFDWLSKAFSSIWVWIIGFSGSILGHLVPIKDMIHFLLGLFLVDVVCGWLAARKIRGEKFNTRIIWKTTVPRMFASITMIIAVFTWDSVYYHDYFLTYKLIAWFFSGLLLISIAKNLYHITNWNPFRILSSAVIKTVEKQTGLDIELEETKDERTN